jgi:alpha-beta hydrolase superfamily lysophospholipase
MGRRVAATLPLAVLALAACVPAPASWPEGAVPIREWPAEAAPVRAQIVALHGFNDHKGAFVGLARALAPLGIVVRSYDQPGFGQAPGRGFWAGSERLAMALHEQVRAARSAQPEVPLIVLGESMGAAVAVVALARPDAPAVDGVVLASPAVWGGPTLGPVYRASLETVRTLVPGFVLSGGVGGVRASDNLPMLRELGRDPAYILRTRVDALAGLVDLMDEARAAAPALGGRVLVLTGARDQVVRPALQTSFARTLGTLDCTLARYPEGWHLLLRDLGSDTVVRDLVAWIDGGMPPSGAVGPCVAESG